MNIKISNIFLYFIRPIFREKNLLMYYLHIVNILQTEVCYICTDCDSLIL